MNDSLLCVGGPADGLFVSGRHAAAMVWCIGMGAYAGYRRETLTKVFADRGEVHLITLWVSSGSPTPSFDDAAELWGGSLVEKYPIQPADPHGVGN